MKIYNEKTKQIEEFKSINPNEVLMYVCGPTIYSDIHIGNARPIIFFNFVRNLFEKNGYKVMYVSNVTDVDDKIIAQANKLNVSEQELVDDNLKRFNALLKQLNITYDKQPRVMQNMEQIIDFIDALVKQSYDYCVDGDVYFDVSKIKDYGKLSNLDLENTKKATRIKANEKKQNEHDFTLWKKTDQGIKWSSPWSLGRPGWHTECVVMIQNILGSKIDIHGGGIDLQFPHHENENAQSIACGNELANYWMHNGFINIDDQKMSKSIGNTILAKDFINQYNANILKLIMLQTNYRQPININEEFILATKQLDKKIYTYRQLQTNLKTNYQVGDVLEIANNDFDSVNLITYLLQALKNHQDENEIIVNNILELLGLDYPQYEVPDKINQLALLRDTYKQERAFDKADEIRDEINQLGYELIDTKKGSKCIKMMD